MTTRTNRGLLVITLAALAARPAAGGAVHDAAFNGDLDTLRHIVANDPGQLTALDGKERTVTARAARGGHFDAVMYLLDAGAPHADNAAWEAADAGHLDLLRALLDRGVSPRTANGNGTTILMLAASSDHVDICRFLVGLDLDPALAKADGRTALHYAGQYGGPAAARYLLEIGVPVDPLTGTGWSPLHYAARNGHVEVVRVLIEHGAEIRRKTAQRTKDDGAKMGDHAPLHLAAIYGHTEAARVLLGADAQIDEWSFHYRTPLMEAVRGKHYDTAELLVARGADTEISGFDNETALHKACRADDTEMIRLLVDHGADVQAQTGVGYGPVPFLIGKGNAEALRHVIAAGGNPRAVYDGNTALLVAVVKGDVKLVRLLLDKGVSLRTEDNGDSLLLAEAAFKGHFEIVKLLVEHGADPAERKPAVNYGSVVEGAYITPVWGAAKSENLPIVRYLIEQGAPFDLPGPMQMTPLEIAAAGGHLPMMALLIEHGAAIDGAGNGSPLTSAVGLNRPRAAEMLLERGADPNGRDGQGEYRPLHEAAAHGRIEIARRLLAAGADPTTISLERTPVVVAVSNGQAEMVRLLIEHGVDPSIAANAGDSVLIEAINDDHRSIVRFLLHQASVRPQIEHRLGNGRTPLIQATRLGRVEIVEMLVAAGADVGAAVPNDAPRSRGPVNERGSTALQIAEGFLRQDYPPDSYEAGVNARLEQIARLLRAHTVN